MKQHSILFRFLSLSLAIICLALTLCACGNKEDTVDEKTVVGTIDGKDVYYDEIYYLVKGYEEVVKNSCGDDTGKQNEKYRTLIAENITETYAMLHLCEAMGVTYNEKDWEDQIDEQADAYITNFFEGNEDDFRASREEQGLTERYFRYILGTELIYEELLTLYPEKGLVPSTEAEIRAAIKKNFIHVYHLALFNDEGDDAEKNYAKMETALGMLRSGESSMYDLISKGYTEDFSDPSGKGYYIVKGTMEESYEKAAFDLDVLEISDIVVSQGTNNVNQLVPCYYIIQRFALDEEYIEENFYELQTEYYGSVISKDMEEIRATLTFEPNDFYNSLDLSNLPKVEEGTTAKIVWICVGVGCAVLIAGAVTTVVILKKKHAKKNLPVQKRSKT
ncbi:MAG: hypothetical protein IJY47_00260 [Clostridia bacterium]|nr:hypothetical protein [Clostridia bacterium]